MSTACRRVSFGFMYTAIFFGTMWVCTDGALDIAAAASVPIILCAETIVLTMFYMTTFHGEQHETARAIAIPSLASALPNLRKAAQPQEIPMR